MNATNLPCRTDPLISSTVAWLIVIPMLGLAFLGIFDNYEGHLNAISSLNALADTTDKLSDAIQRGDAKFAKQILDEAPVLTGNTADLSGPAYRALEKQAINLSPSYLSLISSDK